MHLTISKNLLLILLIGGIVLVVFGAILGLKVFPGLIEEKIWEQTVLKEDTPQWEIFKRIPFSFPMQIYFFHVENPDDVLQGSKPRVREVGPYVYKAYRWKSDITWQNDDDISYYEYLRFEFDDLNSGKYVDSDKVTILNTALYAFLQTVEQTQPDAVGSVASTLDNIFHENSGLFMTVSVKDLMFEGLPICKDWGVNGGFVAKMVCQQFREKVAQTKPMRISDNSIMYALMEYKNNTHLGRFTVKSGLKNREETGRLVRYEYEPFMSVWEGIKSKCNEIRGITLFPAFVTTEMEFDTFGEDVCRIFRLTYDQSETIRGIPGYRFVARNDSFDSSEHNKDNSCFCVTNKTRKMNGNFGCLKDGVMDLTPCLSAPMILSFPHLLYADTKYLSAVEGLRPNKTLHENYVTLEPHTGAPLKAGKRVQFNMFVRPMEDVPILENVTKTLMPMFWIEEGLELPEEFTDKIKNELLFKLNILSYIKWGIIAVGVIIIAVTFTMIIKLE